MTPPLDLDATGQEGSDEKGVRDATSSSVAPPPSPHSWAFWRQRLGRLLVIGGLALAATQLLPAWPREHEVTFEAPPGRALSHLQITWTAEGESDASGGVTLHPVRPTDRVRHEIRVPPGSYELLVTATFRTDCDGKTPCKVEGPTRIVLQRRTLKLEGEHSRVKLRDE